MKKELIRLLKQHSYIFEFKDTIVDYEELVAKETIYKIYKRRLMISNKISKQLVDNLKSSPDKDIKLIKLSDINKKEFLIFTNESVSVFIGIIKLT